MIIRHPNNDTDRRRGAALVELALVLPIFMMVVLGIVEFGRAMMVGQMVTNASREGARLAITGEYANADVVNHIKGFLTAAANVSSGDITVSITVTPGPGSDTNGHEVSQAQSGDVITVSVSVPFDRVSYVPGSYLSGKLLAGTSTMRHE